LATTGQFPYVVSIIENFRHFFSGFIYSNRWIVSRQRPVLRGMVRAMANNRQQYNLEVG
jgi:hypothetical protein